MKNILLLLVSVLIATFVLSGCKNQRGYYPQNTPYGAYGNNYNTQQRYARNKCTPPPVVRPRAPYEYYRTRPWNQWSTFYNNRSTMMPRPNWIPEQYPWSLYSSMYNIRPGLNFNFNLNTPKFNLNLGLGMGNFYHSTFNPMWYGNGGFGAPGPYSRFNFDMSFQNRWRQCSAGNSICEMSRPVPHWQNHPYRNQVRLNFGIDFVNTANAYYYEPMLGYGANVTLSQAAEEARMRIWIASSLARGGFRQNYLSVDFQMAIGGIEKYCAEAVHYVHYMRCSQDDKNDIKQLIQTGQAYIRSGQYTKAVVVFDAAVMATSYSETSI
ncbi:MAG: hypothetical protein ABIA04_13665 [Pseudomonadota bacterium]